MGSYSPARRQTKSRKRQQEGGGASIWLLPLGLYPRLQLRSGDLHGGQRRALTDYPRLVWGMKNGLASSSPQLYLSAWGPDPTGAAYPPPRLITHLKLSHESSSQRGKGPVELGGVHGNNLGSAGELKEGLSLVGSRR